MRMRKLLLGLVAMLVVVVSSQVALAASGAKYEPRLTYIGAWRTAPTELGWVIRAIGVNSSYAAVTKVSFGLPDGSSVVLDAVTGRFSSGAGNAQWGTGEYVTVIPTGAVTVSADVTLINLKKPGVALDVRHVEDTLDTSYVGNLYCDPVLYASCP
jgi:hypothetical protein